MSTGRRLMLYLTTTEGDGCHHEENHEAPDKVYHPQGADPGRYPQLDGFQTVTQRRLCFLVCFDHPPVCLVSARAGLDFIAPSSSLFHSLPRQPVFGHLLHRGAHYLPPPFAFLRARFLTAGCTPAMPCTGSRKGRRHGWRR